MKRDEKNIYLRNENLQSPASRMDVPKETAKQFSVSQSLSFLSIHMLRRMEPMEPNGENSQKRIKNERSNRNGKFIRTCEVEQWSDCADCWHHEQRRKCCKKIASMQPSVWNVLLRPAARANVCRADTTAKNSERRDKMFECN